MFPVGCLCLICWSYPQDRSFSFTSPISCSDGLVCCIPILSARCPLSCFILHVCQAGFSTQQDSLSTWKPRRGVSIEQRQDTCRGGVGWGGGRHVCENSRSDRLNRLDSEAQLSPARDRLTLPPRVTHIHN